MSESSNPLAHRTTLTLPQGQDVLRHIRRITGAWLNRKFGRVVPMASGLHHLDGIRVLLSQVAYRPDGAESAMRLQLREDTTEATWRTTVTAVEADDGAPAAVTVALECFANPGHLPEPARPRLVEQLVDALPCTDGSTPLTLDPLRIHAGDVPRLIDVLCDPDRRLPAVVAARPLREDRLWAARLAKAMPKCAGDASLYLLETVPAIDAFRAAAEHHRVAPGAVRTFLPEVDPAWPADAPRHRYSTVGRLADRHGTASWDTIVRMVQRIATENPLPDALRTIGFPDGEQQRRDQRRAALHTAHSGEETLTLREQVKELTALLEMADEEIEQRRSSEELALRTVASLERVLRGGRTLWEQDMEEHLLALEETERARAEADVLRARLARTGRVAETVIVEPLPSQPTSFEQLWDQRAVFEHVVVTAEQQHALALDESDRSRVWAAKVWSALRALDRYGRDAHEGFHGGFYEHCQSDRSQWPVKKVAMAETGATMAKYGDQRTLPVPTAYAPCGRAPMQPHLKIDNKGESPRVHFLDDTKGATGKVIVGYIGAHLTNTKTN
ncbi:hypothetical protein LG634_11155 [Streptomyces bambusae]|uniref:hypothetical protein n=1 Tax=Streptomyces bambusae TaxID=1550616 RepID=UPI001CFE0629|nr:hypothetical protein [Streptomyces bambusae]MCB5165386.1 hypothetical protein [Streptomyces bambusae]